LQVPSLWLSGRRDRLVPAGAMPAAAALARDARSVVIANAGHAPFLTAADRVAQEIDDFMRAQAHLRVRSSAVASNIFD